MEHAVEYGKINWLVAQCEFQLRRERVIRRVSARGLLHDVVPTSEGPAGSKNNFGLDGGKRYTKIQLLNQSGEANRFGIEQGHEILLGRLKIFSSVRRRRNFLLPRRRHRRSAISTKRLSALGKPYYRS